MNANKLKILSYTMLSAGLISSAVETIYFGSNWLPQSPAEACADLVCGSMVLIAMLIRITLPKHE